MLEIALGSRNGVVGHLREIVVSHLFKIQFGHRQDAGQHKLKKTVSKTIRLGETCAS